MPTEGIIHLQYIFQGVSNCNMLRSLFGIKFVQWKVFLNYIYNWTDEVIKEADVFLALISLIYELNYVGLEYTTVLWIWVGTAILFKTWLWCYYSIHSALRTLIDITYCDHFGP